tara:strand:- start:164 stop:541 length:378 start_codon:yes stop_codon:yes gene_type:complete
MKTKKITLKQLKLFGFIFIILFPIVSYPILINSKAYLIMFIFIELYFLYLVIFNARKLEFLTERWLKVGNFLGKINSIILISIFFYLIMTPVSFFIKISKLLSLKKPPKSYYIKPIRESDFTEEY